MSTAVAIGRRAAAVRPLPSRPADVALLGCGNVGGAVLRLLAERSTPHDLRITHALVRDARRARPATPSAPLTEDARAIFSARPAVVVELLGGLEPARRFVLEALERRIPVVTANKSLLARCGAEIRTAAIHNGTPLLYEAAVIAGVPFLGTFARRPHAASGTGLQGIVNGTSNYVLTLCAAGGREIVDAVADAQRLGYAEPDPHNDIAGIDACEKLVVLLQQFAGVAVSPDAIETEGLGETTRAVAADAIRLGGVIKPVVIADWTRGLEAFAGPAFVPGNHPLASVDGVENALLLDTARGRLHFQGPGAGPEVTAATVLDDVHEIVSGFAGAEQRVLRTATPRAPETGWLVSLEAARLPPAVHLADFFSAHGVYVRRSTDRHSSGGRTRQAFLTLPLPRPSLERALAGISRAAGCETTHLRALEGRQ